MVEEDEHRWGGYDQMVENAISDKAMPTRSRFQTMLQRLFQRSPVAEASTLGVLDLWYQLALLPFRRLRREGTPSEDQRLALGTDAYNRAAEEYFARFDAPSFLLNKPFSEPAALPKHLIDVGVLIAALRLAPADVVLELGAGSCWLSHMLNRYGCTTVSVDVSKTAIELGRQLFEADSRTNWDLGPRFLVYDGHRLPVEDGSCDRIVINDAFHHVPNQRELLTEMYRVLRPDGLVAMSEPGRGHAAAEHSIEEAREWGVLENELVLEDLGALARDCGFEQINVVVTSPLVRAEVDVRDLGAFMGGKGFAKYWKSFCSALEQHHYILCFKGQVAPTTRRPAHLSAQIEMVDRPPETCQVGTSPRMTLGIVNSGDTLWLGGDRPTDGWTRIGAHLYRGGSTGQLLDFDWWRGHLPAQVSPGEAVTLDVILPPLADQGEYVVSFDLVIEGVAWFAGRGSPPLSVGLRIR